MILSNLYPYDRRYNVKYDIVRKALYNCESLFGTVSNADFIYQKPKTQKNQKVKTKK
jgi:hypothetical protein